MASVGDLTLTIDADDKPLNQKLDSLEARIAALTGKLSGMNPSMGGPGGGTFGGPALSAGNQMGAGFTAFNAEQNSYQLQQLAYSRSSAVDRDFELVRQGIENRFGPQQYSMSSGRSRNSYRRPARTEEEDRGGGSSLGRLLMPALFGAWEINRASESTSAGELAAALSSNPVDKLNALGQGTRGAFGGIFGSAIGLGLDLFGAGPVSVGRSITEASSVYQSQDRSDAQRRSLNTTRAITDIDPQGAGQFGRTEASLRGNYKESTDPLKIEIERLRSELQGRSEVEWGAGKKAAGIVQASIEAVTGKAGTLGISHDTDYTVQGSARITKQNELKTAQDKLVEADLKLQDDLIKNYNDLQEYTERNAASVRGTVRQANFVRSSTGATEVGFAQSRAELVRGQGIDAIGAAINAAGTNPVDVAIAAASAGSLATANNRAAERAVWDAEWERDVRTNTYQTEMRSREIVRQDLINNKPLSAQIDQIRGRAASRIASMGGFFAGGFINPLAVGEAGEAGRDIAVLKAQFDRESAQISTGLTLQRRSLQQSIDRNPIGAEATSIEAQTLQQAQQLQNSERPDLARRAAENGILGLTALRTDYLNSFRAQQFDLRDNVISPRDQESPTKILSSIEASVKEIQTAIANGNYTVEQ